MEFLCVGCARRMSLPHIPRWTSTQWNFQSTSMMSTSEGVWSRGRRQVISLPNLTRYSYTIDIPGPIYTPSPHHPFPFHSLPSSLHPLVTPSSSLHPLSTIQGYSVSEQRRQDQKTVDDQMVACIKAIPHLKHYLSARFSLHKGQYPHRMVF